MTPSDVAMVTASGTALTGTVGLVIAIPLALIKVGGKLAAAVQALAVAVASLPCRAAPADLSSTHPKLRRPYDGTQA